MSLQLGNTATDFIPETMEGKIDFYEFPDNSREVIFPHPADYTVCTTELGRTEVLENKFEKRGHKLIAVSVDPFEKYSGWGKSYFRYSPQPEYS